MTVLRWHNNPNPALRNSGDCIEAHQKRVCDLCCEIAARIGLPLVGSDLPRAALHHDEAERVLGDMPNPAKAKYPELADAYKRAEKQVLAEMGHTWTLTAQEHAILRLADRADHWRWAVIHQAAHTDDWQQAKRDLYRMAWGISPECGAWWESFWQGVER